jgi:hypothetical protein
MVSPRGRAKGERGVGPAAAAPVLALFLLAAAGLSAEVSSSVSITGYGSVLRAGDRAVLAGTLESSLELQSRGNPNVKGYFQLETLLAGGFLVLDVPRAYVKVRFPWFRTMLGKNRVSWGDGFVFNAGDVVFGATEAIAGDLTAETLRDETAWLAEVYLPLGSFSFLEGVIFPYDLQAGALVTGFGGAGSEELSESAALLSPVRFQELAGGIRGAFKPGATTVEAGFFSSGREGEHRPYLSLHGHLLVDWNLSASLAIPIVEPEWREWDDWLALSAGLFHLIGLPLDRSLSVRLEAGIRPGLSWRESPGGSAYGIYLFPELVFTPSNTLSLQLRCLFSPVDLSALTAASVSWNVYQGLTVLGHFSFMAGDKDDLYAWNRDFAVACSLGLEFIY